MRQDQHHSKRTPGLLSRACHCAAELEEVLHGKGDNPVSDLDLWGSEGRINHLRTAVSIRFPVQVQRTRTQTAVRERPLRMVHEVESFYAELKLSAFAHLEVLKERQVTGPIPGSKDLRQNEWPVLSGAQRESKTVPVNVLVGTRTTPWIAGHDRR